MNFNMNNYKYSHAIMIMQWDYTDGESYSPEYVATSSKLMVLLH